MVGHQSSLTGVLVRKGNSHTDTQREDHTETGRKWPSANLRERPWEKPAALILNLEPPEPWEDEYIVQATQPEVFCYESLNKRM